MPISNQVCLTNRKAQRLSERSRGNTRSAAHRFSAIKKGRKINQLSKAKNWTQEELDELLKMYKEENSISYLSKHFHVRPQTIKTVLGNNIKKFDIHKGKTFTSKVEQQICELYLTNRYTLRLLAKKYECSTYIIKNILNRNHIESNPHPRKVNNNVVDDFFEIIDTEEKAYFLGFVFADGNIFKNQLTLEIHVKDIDLLEKLKECLKSDAKITTRKRKNTEVCCLRIVSDKLTNDLKKNGVVPNKTYIAEKLPNIPSNLAHHFLRGLIDGDGWIIKKKDGYYALGFVNYSHNICMEFKELCNSFLSNPNKAKVIKKDIKGHCFACQFQSQEQIRELVTALYNDSSIYLNRKYAVAESILNIKR